jgi:hypothetical protein
MLNRILLIAFPGQGGDGGGTPAPAPAAAPAPGKPAAAPAAAAPAPAASAPASDTPSDDPFEPPKKSTPPPATPTGASPTAAPPAAPEDIDKLAPKDLRERVKQLRTESQASATRVKDLEAKIKAWDEKGLDTTALTARLAAVEKERDDAYAERRAAKQEASPEFKEKWDKPFNLAAERAKRQVTELTVTDPESGESRPATWADFAALYALPVGKAIEQANAIFGASANFVLQQRERLLELDDARKSALEEERAHFKERDNQEVAEQAKEREQVASTWRVTNSRLAETHPDYKDDPEDTEAMEARKHALTVFDTKVEGADRGDFIKKKLLRDAHIRQRVGAYPVLKLKLSRLEAKNAELQKQVEALKGTDPRKTSRPGGADTGGDADSIDWGKGLADAVRE